VRKALVVASLLFALTLPAMPQSEPVPTPAPQRMVSRPFESEADTVAVLKGYLIRMEVTPEVSTEKEYPILSFTKRMTNATHRVRVVVDMKRELVYVFLNRYLVLPEDHPNRDAVLRALMKKNWDLNIGKFEWDPSDGELRFSYCFSTENGVGYDAFNAVVMTLLQTGDKLWPDYRAMVEKPGK
jgi:hypothetical protein